MTRPQVLLLGVVALSVTLGSGCSGNADPPAAPAKTQVVRLTIPDWSLRPAGTSCAGAGPYRFAHAEAPFVIQDDEGREIARGTLPSGTSEKAMDVDFNSNVRREPTLCVMRLEVEAEEQVEGHLLVLDGRPGVPIKKSETAEFAGEVVVS
ncbi:hypothetical protein C1I95_15850 [Micromonospora craterilacus]|uniref:Lipoprotein n=1 Tax=Micromonospora craterilacus TaxID=1655439 RepID=A0A2W2EUM5_9ACTN|nr:hypothetical protein [Micromonospora craterilacus]PZG17270.1 hypothetical protein C1I95_15850 [Micromonospora craterilacus]